MPSLPRAGGWRRPLGGFETAMVAIIVAVLVTVSVRAMSNAAREAEWARHVGAVNDIRSALMLHAMVSVVRGERAALAALSGSNPAELMLRVPIRYGGELDPRHSEGGRWYFDSAQRTLVYVPRWPAPGTRLAAPLHYRVQLLFDDSDGDGRFAAPGDRFRAVTFERHPARPRLPG